jgi:exodeoxyribonuclease-3
MRVTVATWNVNSIRARIDVVVRWLEEKKPTVLCMQETKVQNDLFPVERFSALGYHLVINGQKTWNGVAIASTIEPGNVSLGLPSGFLPEQKRVITATIAGLRVTCVYVPNGGEVGHERFGQKLVFLDLLAEMAESEESGTPYVMTGDFNVAPGNDDVYDPAELKGAICFHPDERSRIERTIKAGMTDLYRKFNPTGKAFSWWDYRAAGFRRNRGMRLDLMLTNFAATELAVGCLIDTEPRSWEKTSDHTPVVAELVLPVE